MQTSQTLAPETRLSDAISDAWDGTDTNEQAADNLLAAMRRDPALYALAMAPVEREVALRLTAEHKRQRRAYIWSRPAQPDNRVIALARSNAVTVLDMRLPSGKRLGDARRDDVMDAAQSYNQAAKYHASKGRFFAAVARKLKGTRCVADVWTAAALEALRHE